MPENELVGGGNGVDNLFHAKAQREKRRKKYSGCYRNIDKCSKQVDFKFFVKRRVRYDSS